ncbi:hypothetical protein B566_EDAN006303 [Ephemera danica]|nr:hypothetical protein B566_EDAN006303 [Ephemera danica]
MCITKTMSDNGETCYTDLRNYFRWPDYLVCCLMLLVSAGIGVFYGLKARKKEASTNDVLMAGRKMGTIPMAMSLLARLELTSAYEILYMPIVVYAPALALNQVTGIDTYAAVTVIFVVCIFYTSVGGIKAVMWTDTFQVVMMFLGMLAVMLRGNFSIEGGTAQVWKMAEDSNRVEFFNMDVDPRTRHTFWTMVVGGSFLWCSTYAANQAQIQRYLTVPTERQAVKALWINCVALIVLLFVCCWCGLVTYAKYAYCDPLTSQQIDASDQLLPLLVMDTMNDLPGVPGLFVAGIFSGALSTVSTGLSALSAITLRDFISGCCGIKMSDSRAARLSKWISVGYGLISFGFVFVVAQLGAVLQAALSIHGMVGGPILGLFTLGIFVPWANATGALAGGISSLLFVFWIGFGAQFAAAAGQVYFEKKPTTADFELYAISYMWYTAIGWTICMLVGIVVSLLTTPQDPRKLNRAFISPPMLWLLDHLPLSWKRKLRWHENAEEPKPETELTDTKFDKKSNNSVTSKLSTMQPMGEKGVIHLRLFKLIQFRNVAHLVTLAYE